MGLKPPYHGFKIAYVSLSFQTRYMASDCIFQHDAHAVDLLTLYQTSGRCQIVFTV